MSPRQLTGSRCCRPPTPSQAQAASPAGDLSSQGCKTPAQVGSSFFSFVNYLARAPWHGRPCLLGLPECSGLAALPPAPSLPNPASPVAAAAAAATTQGSREAQESWPAGATAAEGGAPEKAANGNQKARSWRLRRSGLPGLRLAGWVAASGDPPVCLGQRLETSAGSHPLRP